MQRNRAEWWESPTGWVELGRARRAGRPYGGVGVDGAEGEVNVEALDFCVMWNCRDCCKFCLRLWRSSRAAMQWGYCRLVGKPEGPEARRKQEARNIPRPGGQLERSFHSPSMMKIRVECTLLMGSLWAIKVSVNTMEEKYKMKQCPRRGSISRNES